MFNSLQETLLRLLRVPAQPTPPSGAAGSVLIFRAARNYYRYRLLMWAFSQFILLAVLVGSFVTLGMLESASSHHDTSPGHSSSGRSRGNKLLSQVPGILFGLLRLFEGVALIFYILLALVTYVQLRLEYEQRWYIVTDRSLRIRTGLWNVSEMTMSFANLQKIGISQGPIDRLFGIADVEVESAGGGARSIASDKTGHRGPSLHTGTFQGVENAVEIRDLISERLRLYRQAGLGDPDERHAHKEPHPDDAVQTSATIVAARQMLEEVRALRISCHRLWKVH